MWNFYPIVDLTLLQGELVFGDSYRENFCEDGDREGMVESALAETIVFEILGEVPSLFNVLWWFPTTKALRTMDDCAEVALKQRRRLGSQTKDMMTFLVSARTLSPAWVLKTDPLFSVERDTRPCPKTSRYSPPSGGDHCDPGGYKRHFHSHHFRFLLPRIEPRNLRQAEG